MANISSLGLGSGIDAESIITQLMTVEKAPIQKAEAENEKLSTKLSTWGRVQSNFSALKDAAAALTKPAFWNATTATSSDDKAVSVTTGAGSTAGSYRVNVKELAQAQYLTSGAVASKTTPIGQGTIKIELGRYRNDDPDATPPPPAITFAAKADAAAVNITIGPNDNTLEKIRDKINTSGSGVTASLVSDASGVRLVLRGSTGQDNAFRVSVEEDAGAPGLSALAYDGADGGVKNMTRSQEAKNAAATINGVDVTSSSNTFSDVIDGLTIKVSKKTTDGTTSTPVDINVSEDKDSIKKGIDAFATAYNDLVGLIRVQTLYDETSKTAGPLQGDSTANGLLRQVRSLVSTSSTASGVFKQLSDVGLEMGTDGRLKTNSTKLSKAMEKLPEMQKFFGTTIESEDDAPKEGIAERFRKLAARVTDSEGSISSRQEGIKQSIKRNEDKIERQEDRNLLVEARLRKQYTMLDQNMAQMSSLSNYVAQQLSLLSK